MKYKHIEKFVNYLNSEKNYSDFTGFNYSHDLIEFFDFIKKDELNINEMDIKKFLKYLYDKKLSRNSICRKISSLKSFYNFLVIKKYIKINPTENIGYPKKEKRLPKFIYYNELEDILNEAGKGNFGDRNLLIIELLYATGMRISELINVKLSDIDRNKRTIKVLGKGNVERIVYYGEYASEILNEYLNNTRKKYIKNKNHNYLLINKNGDKITDRGVRLIFDNILKKVNIKTKISPHTLRHTFATHLLDNGCDLKVVQELLGHKHLTTTEIYTHISNERLKEVYHKCHPRS